MVLRLITEGEFRSSRYGQLADQIDGRLSDLIEQAESYIETRLDRTLSREAYEERPHVGKVTLFLRQSPVIEVDSVRIGGQEIDPNTYIVDKEEGTIELTSNTAEDSDIIVKYTAGFDPIPPVIKTATILQTAYFAYQDFEIYGSGDGKPPGIRYFQEDILEMIEPFKRRGLI